MNKKYSFALLFLLLLMSYFSSLQAQVDDAGEVIDMEEEEFDMDNFEIDESVKTFCNNKIINLNPTTLVGLSYDFMFGAELNSVNPEGDTTDFDYTSNINLNHGMRLDANFPLVSKSSIILNATVSIWESRYNFDNPDTRDALAVSLNNNPLRTATVGLLAFKPLDEKHFMIFQAATSLNGNFNFDGISPDFSKMKYTASILYGWKFSDYQNLAIGVTRTYRGGRALHIPILLWNKTFNQKWGMELLLPARGGLRYNFSAKSSLNLGYELEGQSYLLQNSPNLDLFPTNEYELRKSEIRGRLMLSQALSSFFRLNLQAGVAPSYRFALDNEASARAGFDEGERSVGSLDLPFYFRIGLNFVSP